jgi:hypothetical protein
MSDPEDLSLQELIDHVTEGNIKCDRLNELKEELEEGHTISSEEGLDMCEDLVSLRLAFTIEELVKTTVFHLLKSKSNNKKALRDYRKSLRLLSFIVARTKEFVDLEETRED